MEIIAKQDPNMPFESKIKDDGVCYFDAEQEPFRIYGIFRDGDCFRRIPESLAQTVNDGVVRCHSHSAGGRVRFVTDSPYIGIKVVYENIPEILPHMALTGSAGFDMFAKEQDTFRYLGVCKPPVDLTLEHEWKKKIEYPGEKIITMNLPIFSTIKKLYIGVKEGSVLKTAPEYRYKKPVVFYGSSITQGGCATNPGGIYESVLSRKLDCDFINLGFSGSARGEDTITEYIKNLDMSLFVLDYDHNAPTIEHLQATHAKMYETIRAAQPELPILIMGSPKYFVNDEFKVRAKIVHETYLKAKANGDRNVYYIPGKELMSLAEDCGTVDKTHPNNLGFFSIAQTLAPVIEKILKEQEGICTST